MTSTVTSLARDRPVPRPSRLHVEGRRTGVDADEQRRRRVGFWRHVGAGGKLDARVIAELDCQGTVRRREGEQGRTIDEGERVVWLPPAPAQRDKQYQRRCQGHANGRPRATPSRRISARCDGRPHAIDGLAIKGVAKHATQIGLSRGHVPPSAW